MGKSDQIFVDFKYDIYLLLTKIKRNLKFLVLTNRLNFCIIYMYIYHREVYYADIGRDYRACAYKKIQDQVHNTYRSGGRFRCGGGGSFGIVSA